MDQANGRFSVDWVVGRDLDVGGSELRDLGFRTCEIPAHVPDQRK
jgi:hypothetical protein